MMWREPLIENVHSLNRQKYNVTPTLGARREGPIYYTAGANFPEKEKTINKESTESIRIIIIIKNEKYKKKSAKHVILQ